MIPNCLHIKAWFKFKRWCKPFIKFTLLIIIFLPFNLKSQSCTGLSVSPSISTLKGCSPLVLKFSAIGGGAGAKYNWDFGAGYVSASDTTNKVYITPGFYDVKVAITQSGGNKCTLTVKNIEVLASPKPIITFSPKNSNCLGTKTITFIDSTVGGGKSEWVIGGTSYLGQKQIVKFPTTGSVPVSLKVTNAVGCFTLRTENNLLTIGDSGASDFCATMKQTSTGMSATFISNAFGTSPIKKYKWDFLGGTPSSDTTSRPPTVNYLGLSSRDVSLTITCANGCVYVKKYGALITDYIRYTPDSGCLRKNFLLTIKGTGSGKNQFGWSFDGGDVYSGFPTDTVRFNTPGLKDATLSIKYNGNGCIHTFIKPAAIKVFGPRADFDAKNRFICSTKDTVKISSTSDTFGNSKITYKWEITDSMNVPISGSPFTLVNKKDLKFFFTKNGRFNVRLTATGDKGCVDTISKKNYFIVRSPKGNFTIDSPIICLGKKVKLDAKPVPADDPKNPYQYLWIVENVDTPGIVFNLTKKSPVLTPDWPGFYNLILVTQSGTQCIDTLRVKKFLQVNGGIGRIKVRGSLSGCSPDSAYATFSYKNRYPDTLIPGGLKLTWSLKIDKTNGVIDSLSDSLVKVKVLTNGCYTLNLKIQDSNKCIFNKSASMGCYGVEANFKIDPAKCVGDSVKISVQNTPAVGKVKWVILPSNAARISPNDSSQLMPYITFLKDTPMIVSQFAYLTVNGKTCVDRKDTFILGLTKATISISSSVKTAFCAPVLVNFSNNSAGARDYEWNFGDGTPPLKTNAKSLSHIFLKNNNTGFRVTLKATDSATGCTIIRYLNDTLKVFGPQPMFKAFPKIGCDSLLVSFKDSSLNISRFVFDYDDGSPQDTIGSISSHLYKIPAAVDSAIYIPIKVATDNKSCKNFMTDTVRIYRTAISNFSGFNTKGCPPLKVDFTNLSKKAIRYQWDFNNDGIIDDTAKNPSFIYTDTGFFKVILIATGGGNCNTRFEIDSFIHVSAVPVPDLAISDKKLCGTETVSFINNSTFFTSFSIDYGNGKSDINKISPQTYSYIPSSKDSTNYGIKLTLTSSAGCKKEYFDTISAFIIPKIKYNLLSSKGCEPFTANILDVTPYAVKFKWDLNNDGTVEDSLSSFRPVLKEGKYDLYYNIETRAGCRDSVLLNNIFESYFTPNPSFSLSDTLVCYKERVKFNYTGTSNPFTNFRYNFDEVGNMDSSILNNPEYSYSVFGKHLPRLITFTNQGCRDTAISRSITVRDTAIKIIPEIDFVSLEDSLKVLIQYKLEDSTEIGKYQLIRFANAVSGKESFLRNNSEGKSFKDSSIGLNPFKTSYSYQLNLVNVCGYTSNSSVNHKTILLKISSIGFKSISLNWNAYQGRGVSKYNVVRSKNGSVFTVVASLDSNTLSYSDTSICPAMYQYKIEAQLQGGFVSYSNKVYGEPKYFDLSLPLKLQYVTVIEDTSLEIKWIPSLHPDVSSYHLAKKDSNGKWLDDFALPLTNTYRDGNVSVSRGFYQYRVSVKDNCGNVSPLSLPGSNIVLNAKFSDVSDAIELTWNRYFKFEEGFNHYNINYLDANGNQGLLQTVYSENDTLLSIDKSIKELQGKYCFTIEAVSELKEVSKSNTACAFFSSRTFVPNAFTPNGDGLNDVWKPEMLGINDFRGNEFFEYQLKVFDRWGEKLFETNSPNIGWDGNFKGYRLPLGVYIYFLRAKGFDGKLIIKKGNITIAR